MDGKTNQGAAYTRLNSIYTEKSSSLQDFNNRRSKVVRTTENMAKAKYIITSSSVGNKFICQNPSRLFSSSINRQKPLPSEMSQLFQQKKPIVEKFMGTVKTNVPKCPRKQLESANIKAMPMPMPKTSRFNELPYFLQSTDSATHQPLIEDRKQIRHKPGCGSLYAPTISFTQRLIASKDAKKATKNCSQGARVETKNCNLKNNSSSVSKSVPSVCSQSISVPNRRNTTAISRSFSASSNMKLSGSLNTRLSTSNTSNDSRLITKPKINNQIGMLKPREHSIRGTTRGHQARENLGRSPNESLANLASSTRSLDSDSFSRKKKLSRNDASNRPNSSPEQGRTLSLHDYSTNTDAQMHNSTARVAQHMLESIFFFGSYDQHREMRMDIDNMSYEELLELQEKMGSVSTGLTDEVLTKCLKRSNFKLAPSPSWITDFVEDCNRCSICQEEYDEGEEINTLACEHWYHVPCIQQWLRQKNWCPICKAPASVDSQLMAV